MKIIFGLILLGSFSAQAAFQVECISSDIKVTVSSEAASNLKVAYKGESVDADGILTSDEVDLVAKFPTAGEMTLFAKVGKVLPENYIFINGQRFSVVCR
jgi:hypothetical protein